MTLASRRLQARIQQENAAAVPKAAELTTTFARHPRIDLDALEAAAREALRVLIHTNALIHANQIACDFALLRSRSESRQRLTRREQ
ncbi:MAG: hypothetical protein EOO32_00070 [Comamonadaceae bacterium]|nr:MAG: hypothetical protein EOO32_00070 [Comamonadaceae bacterium]